MGQHAEAQLVERLDEGAPYYLVTIGDGGMPGALVAVDAIQGTVMESARLEHSSGLHLLSQQQAITLANLPQPASGRLVWAPSRASLSPLYPLWQITSGASTVYVDHAGEVWNELPKAGPG